MNTQKTITETLHCQAGHDFQRERVRGRKPVWCDEHRPTVGTPSRTRRVVVQPAVEKPSAPKIVTGPASRSVVDGIFASVRVSDELKRKLRYVDGELDKGREVGDINFLVKVRRELVIEANRAMRMDPVAPELEDEAA